MHFYHLLVLSLVTLRVSSEEEDVELGPYYLDGGDHPVLLLKSRDADQTLGSGGNPDPESGSGSGDLQPVMTTPGPMNTEYDLTVYITLTFADLNKQLYEERDVGGMLADLLVRLLELDVAPMVLFDEEGQIRVYFPIDISSQIQAHAQLLSSSDDPEWMNLTNTYKLLSVDVVEVGGPMPWWHWLIIALAAFMAVSAYCLLAVACCCRFWGGAKRRNPTKVSDSQRPEDVFQMKEQQRQQLVRKVSRVSYQPKSHAHYYAHPLTISDLEQVTLNPASLEAEYAAVPSNMVSMAEVPPGAEDKNRYKDVLPNPQTRVALFLKFGVANSDYINANYIRGYQNSSKSYIATQGPLLWTVADFWRMVWEQRVTSIIMTTKLQERGMVKCVQYWPEEAHSHSIVHEDLQIHLRRRVITKNYTTTTLLLQHQDKMVCREVTHFWFTGWPDHGVPSSAHSLVDFLLHVRKHSVSDIPGPTVVHCSAGIGRTGVVIAADIAMQQLDKEGEVDLLRILSSLRQDRGGMIQTKQQYVFLHKVMLEYAKRNSMATVIGNPMAIVGQRLETTVEEDEINDDSTEPTENDSTTE